MCFTYAQTENNNQSMMNINHNISRAISIAVITVVAVLFVGCGSSTRLSNKTTSSRKSGGANKTNPLASWNKKKETQPQPAPQVSETEPIKSSNEYKSPNIPGYTPPEPYNSDNLAEAERDYTGGGNTVTKEQQNYNSDYSDNYDEDVKPVRKKSSQVRSRKPKYSSPRRDVAYTKSVPEKRYVAATPVKKKVQVVRVPVKASYESPKDIALKNEKDLEMQSLFISGVSASRAGDHAKAANQMRQVMSSSGRADLRKKAKIYYERSLQKVGKVD